MSTKKLRSGVLDPAVVKIMAENLNKSAQSTDPRTTPLYQKILDNLGPERTVIDIGSGVGRFAIPLAQEGCSVTAVEPSEEMRKWLLLSAKKSGVGSSIKVVPEAWPTRETTNAEVSFASFVIQFSDDPVEFIRAMERSTIRECILAVHVDQMMGFLKDIWPVFRLSEEVPAMLTFPVLYPTMLDMDIVADVSVFNEQREINVPEPSRIFEMLADLFNIRSSPPEMKRLKEMLMTTHKERILQRRNVRTAIISWHPVK